MHALNKSLGLIEQQQQQQNREIGLRKALRIPTAEQWQRGGSPVTRSPSHRRCICSTRCRSSDLTEPIGKKRNRSQSPQRAQPGPVAPGHSRLLPLPRTMCGDLGLLMDHGAENRRCLSAVRPGPGLCSSGERLSGGVSVGRASLSLSSEGAPAAKGDHLHPSCSARCHPRVTALISRCSSLTSKVLLTLESGMQSSFMNRQGRPRCGLPVGFSPMGMLVFHLQSCGRSAGREASLLPTFLLCPALDTLLYQPLLCPSEPLLPPHISVPAPLPPRGSEETSSRHGELQ